MEQTPDHHCRMCPGEFCRGGGDYDACVWLVVLRRAALSERDRNVIVAALHFFALRFPGSPVSAQLLGIYELAASIEGLPTREELHDLCERIHPACSLVT